MTRILLILNISIFLGGCGDKNETSSTVDTYSIKTPELDYTCADGSSGKAEGFSKNLLVTISGNEMKVNSKEGDDFQTKTDSIGLVNMKLSGYSGLIEADGMFDLSQSGSASHPDIGNFVLLYYLRGQLLNGQWQGNYKYEVAAPGSGFACEYLTTFSGKKQ